MQNPRPRRGAGLAKAALSFGARAAGQLIMESVERDRAQTRSVYALSERWFHPDDYKDFETGDLWLGRTPDKEYRAVGISPLAHAMTVASSRSGKGVSLIVPNCLKWAGSLVAFDPKGENAQITARARRSMGQSVAVLDPFHTADIPYNCRASYNPFDLMAPHDENAEQYANLIAETFVESSHGDAHFGPTAQGLFAAVILHVNDTLPDDERNLSEVRELLCLDADARLELLEDMSASPRASVRRSALSIKAANEKERSSFFTSAQTQTRLLDDPKIIRLLSSSSFDLTDLKDSEDGLSLFLCLPVDQMRGWSKWLRLMVRLSLKVMLRAGDPATGHRTLFLLDEFHVLRHVEEIEDSAPLMAGAGVLLWPIVTQIATLQRDYPKSWRVFFGNASVLTAFGVDGEEAEFMSRLLGEYGDDFYGHNMPKHAGRVLSPQQIERSFAPESSLMLVKQKGQEVGQLARVTYYEDMSFPTWYPPAGKPSPKELYTADDLTMMRDLLSAGIEPSLATAKAYIRNKAAPQGDIPHPDNLSDTAVAALCLTAAVGFAAVLVAIIGY